MLNIKKKLIIESMENLFKKEVVVMYKENSGASVDADTLYDELDSNEIDKFIFNKIVAADPTTRNISHSKHKDNQIILYGKYSRQMIRWYIASQKSNNRSFEDKFMKDIDTTYKNLKWFSENNHKQFWKDYIKGHRKYLFDSLRDYQKFNAMIHLFKARNLKKDEPIDVSYL